MDSSNYIPVKKLKKQPYYGSFAIGRGQHCALDFLIEEICGIDGLNVLTVGVSECVFYTRKQLFPDKRLNWAYELSEKEIIFGDVSGIDSALSEMSKASNNKTVCITTCIPNIMNLGIDLLIDKRYPQVTYISAPDYKGVHPYDSVEDFYAAVFGGTEVSVKEGVSVWEGDCLSASEIKEKLQYSVHKVNSSKYLKMLKMIAQKYTIKIYDNTNFQSFFFYLQNAGMLNIDVPKIEEARLISGRLSGKTLNIKGACSIPFALFLFQNGVKIEHIVCNAYTLKAYNDCKKLDGEIFLACGADVALPETAAENIDLTEFNDSILSYFGFDRLSYMLKKTEEKCR